MNNMKLVLEKFDQYLSSKGLRFEAIVIGGAALNIMDVTSRVTRDVDLIDPEIPTEIKNASIDFFKKFPELNLKDNWFNNGPISIAGTLPNNWRLRTQKILDGSALTLFTLGRLDFLKTKLYALCDRATDMEDCIKLSPTKEEIDKCLTWVKEGDANLMWPKRVDEMILELKKELGINE